MTKAELINAIASESGLTKAASKKALDVVITSLKSGLQNGERFTFPGFGTFHVAERRARVGRNPRTGKKIQIAAKKVVKFRTSKHIFTPPIDPALIIK